MKSFSVFFAAALAGYLVSHLAQAANGSRESFDMAVPAPPSPVNVAGTEWLIHELHLTNFSGEPLRLTRVEVLSDGSEALKTFEGDELANRVALAPLTQPDARLVKPGERAVVYLEVPLRTVPPRRLRHRVSYVAGTSRESRDVVGGEVAVRAKARLALGPPLRGGPWSAVYAWEWPRGHRRVFYTLDGRARIPGRFAIDWVRKDAQGHSVRGDADIVKNYLGYGADVLAVADARVAAVRDGMDESKRVSANPAHSLDDAAGNCVSLDLGDGRFAIYEHLAARSIRVAPGDRVRRGTAIAALGFTGDSSEPHLHFHVADGPEPLKGEGLPFEIEFEGGRWRPAPSALVTF